MSKPLIVEIACKTALNRVSGMPFRWSLNPYRGCAHGCHYCYAIATHAYLGLNADEFATTIVAKTNLAAILRRELARPSWVRESVAIGTATDPYQPCEGRYRLTRAALEVFHEHASPISIVTKGTLVWRDRDLLASLARQSDVSVNFTITTMDPGLWRRIEPGTPPPWKRLAVMGRLVESGVRCSVFLAPILPGVTDSSESIEAVVRAAKEHGAAKVWSSPLRLAPLVKEHFYGFVADTFPDLIPRYDRAYPRADAPRAYQEGIKARVDRIRARYGFEEADRAAGGEAESGAANAPQPGFSQLTLTM